MGYLNSPMIIEEIMLKCPQLYQVTWLNFIRRQKKKKTSSHFIFTKDPSVNLH